MNKPFTLELIGKTAHYHIEQVFPVVIDNVNSYLLRHKFVEAHLILSFDDLEGIIERSDKFSYEQERINGLTHLIRIIKIAYNKFKITEVEEGLRIDII